MTSQELAAGAAYKFRMLAYNRNGASAAGKASEEAVAGLSISSYLQPPVVRGTSSASFAVALPKAAVPCLEFLAWTVMVRIAPHGWRVLGTGEQGTIFSVERLRCPLDAPCEFKLRPDVHSFGPSDFDGPSTFIQNLKLRKMPTTAVRIEIKLRGASWSGLERAELTATLMDRLDLREEPEVIEVHAGGAETFVVIDLRHWTRGVAQLAAQELVNRLVAVGPGSDRMDGQSQIWDRIDRDTGVLQQNDAGEWLVLLPDGKPARREASHVITRVSVGLFCSALFGLFIRRILLRRGKWRDLKGAVPLATSEEEADNAEARWSMNSRSSRLASSRFSTDDDWPT